jgi:hypothetical protein
MAKSKQEPAGDKPVQEPEQEVMDRDQAVAEQAVAHEDAAQQPTGLQRIESVKGTALQMYGERAIMRELVDRLMAFHPAAGDVGVKGMRQVAQLAITLGISPLPGTNDMHVWTQEKSIKVDGQWTKRDIITVIPGINYHERRALMYGGVEWMVPVQPFAEIDYDLYGVDFDKEMGALCIGCRAAEVERKVAQGWTIKDAQKAARIMGLGTVGRSEDPKKGRPLIWSAFKRARTDFFRQAFPYIPGEQVPPGPGMKWDADENCYVPAYDLHWGALNPALDSGERDVDVPDSMQGEDINEMMFGDAGAEPVVVDTRDKRAASEYLAQ